ncbi:hypothetical protein [Kineosporia sp. NBRC 101731]|uniref:hypothetical protein n=1 Tax=Kineosporia sp. NBRC 101731 TaxID=3032199 RepID=UPI002556564E|nr:hypothetical protein [Kineosporia sp. NBRC 101731]
MTRMTSGGYRPRRPAFFGPAVMDTFQGGPDPAQRIEAAHRTAAALVDHARSSNDPDATARIVALADIYGLDEIAELWAARPAQSLPGALWRIYALQAGIRRDPVGLARAFDEGRHRAPVHEAVAGVADPPGPAEVQDMSDAILGGAFTGDLADALERAAAFCHVVATGWAVQADLRLNADDHSLTRSAGDLARTGTELELAAKMWRNGELS